MRLVKLAIASVNTTVGATTTNVDRALEFARGMALLDVTVGCFQEQLIGGYPPEDLVQWQSFVDAQTDALSRFAAETSELTPVFVLGLVVSHQAHRYNCAAVVHRGRVLGLVPKEKLPTYNVFYEARTFSRGIAFQHVVLADGTPLGDLLFEFDFGTLAVEVCEDAWSPDGPLRRRAYSGAELVVNVSASPYRLGAQGTRREMLCTRSADNQCVLAYANAVGAQDGLVFDGGGFVCQNGRLALEAVRFRAGFEAVVVDLDRTARLRAENTTWREDAQAFMRDGRKVHVVSAREPGPDRSRLRYPTPASRSFFLPASQTETQPSARAAYCEELLDALSLGVGDYFEKNGFKLIGIALSGGRDSLLALLVVRHYLERRYGPDAWRQKCGELVRAFYMPSRYSGEGPRRGASTICQTLGVPLNVSSIDEAFERELEAARSLLGPGESVTPLTEQNIQARLRGLRMWSWSNSTGGLFLQTGNMTEKAVGYTTIGGDLEGGLSVISNVPKTVVIYLLDYLLETRAFEGIDTILSYPAGPELAADQQGEAELMPYVVLDACFALHAGEKMSGEEIKHALVSLFPEHEEAYLQVCVERFLRMFSQSIYKWVQAPLGLHVGNLDLDRERALQLPVVTANEWSRRA
ncbi:MAG: NAD(+) synthase [Myxococcales bacterium]|nr:NAD(+) synthase [Myxococcales bacterium]